MDDWKVVGTEPYTRKDGSSTTLWLWQRGCASCTKPFTVRAPEQHFTSYDFKSTRCVACRDPKLVAAGRKGNAIRAQKNANTQKSSSTRALHCTAKRHESAMFHCFVTASQHREAVAKRAVVSPSGEVRSNAPPAVKHDAGSGAEHCANEPAKNSTQFSARSE